MIKLNLISQTVVKDRLWVKDADGLELELVWEL